MIQRGPTGPELEQDRRCHNRVAKPRTNQPDSTDDGGGALLPAEVDDGWSRSLVSALSHHCENRPCRVIQCSRGYI